MLSQPSAPVSPHPLLSHHSPAPLWLRQARQGHDHPVDPLEGEERSYRGSPAAPRGCAHLAAPPGRAQGTRTRHRSVTSTSPQPQPAQHLQAPRGPAHPPAGLPAPTGTGLSAQVTLTPRHRSLLPHVMTHRQLWCHRATEISALQVLHEVPSSWHPQALPRTRFRPQLQPGATPCPPRVGQTRVTHRSLMAQCHGAAGVD